MLKIHTHGFLETSASIECETSTTKLQTRQPACVWPLCPPAGWGLRAIAPGTVTSFVGSRRLGRPPGLCTWADRTSKPCRISGNLVTS